MTLTAAALALRRLVEAKLGVVERGLGLVDRRLVLGASAVDLVAGDATGSLTLLAVDLTADDELFRGAAGAYWWCRGHPDVIRRRYPDLRSPADQPPRVLFLAQRVARSFLWTMSQLGFEPVHGATLLDLGIDGSATVAIEVREGSRRSALNGSVAAGRGIPASQTRGVLGGVELSA